MSHHNSASCNIQPASQAAGSSIWGVSISKGATASQPPHGVWLCTILNDTASDPIKEPSHLGSHDTANPSLSCCTCTASPTLRRPMCRATRFHPKNTWLAQFLRIASHLRTLPDRICFNVISGSRPTSAVTWFTVVTLHREQGLVSAKSIPLCRPVASIARTDVKGT